MAEAERSGPKRLKLIDGAFFFLLGIALLTGGLAVWLRGPEALVEAGRQLASDALFIGPQIVLGVMVGAFFTVLVPKHVVSRLLGQQAGFRGILLASVLGTVMPGGPFTAFPLLYALGRSGAGIGALIAFLVAWGTVGLHRLIIWEIPFMGVEFASLRFVTSMPLPVIAGLIADRLAAHFEVFRMKWD